MQQQLTLYVDGYFVNQWDACCMIALAEKGVPYATARALLRDGGGVPRQLSDHTGIARVPALQHGDTWLTESSAIVEYLEDVFPPPSHGRLLPADPRARARARQLMSFVRYDAYELLDDRRHPPLEALDRLSNRLIWVGFPIFTVALVLGAIWVSKLGESLDRLEYPLAVVTWLAYAGLLVARQVYGWRGRRAARLTLAGFVAALAVLAIYLVRRMAG